MMGTEPLESEIPIEYEDLPTEVQLALTVYEYLRDDYDAMSGTYRGKVLIGIFDIMNILDLDRSEYRQTLDLIKMIDYARKQLDSETNTTPKETNTTPQEAPSS
jgi:hypothetical protein